MKRRPPATRGVVNRERAAMTIRYGALILGTVALFSSEVMLSPARAQDAIPEPDAIFIGTVIGAPGSSIVRFKSLLGETLVDNVVVTAGHFTARVRLVSIANGATIPPAAATVGSRVEVFIGAVAQGYVIIGERGAIYGLSFDYSADASDTPPELPTFDLGSVGSVTPVPTATATTVATSTAVRTSGTPTPSASTTPIPEMCPGDCNGDKKRSASELATLNGILLSCPCASPLLGGSPEGCVGFEHLCLNADINGDGCVTASEKARINAGLLEFGTECPTQTP